MLPFALPAPSFGRNPFGSGFAGMSRSGKTAIPSKRWRSCATWRLVAGERSAGIERITRSASSSVNASIATFATSG